MKVWNTLAMMIGMIIFMYFLGFDLGVAERLNPAGIYLNSTNMSASKVDVAGSSWYTTLWGAAGVLLVIGLGSAITIGYLTKSFDFKIALIPFFTAVVIVFVSFGWSAVELARNTGEDWLSGIVVTVFGLITVMFVFSVVEWFGGSPSE